MTSHRCTFGCDHACFVLLCARNLARGLPVPDTSMTHAEVLRALDGETERAETAPVATDAPVESERATVAPSATAPNAATAPTVTTTAPQRPSTARAKSGKPVAAPPLDDATERALCAAGWTRSPRAGWWRDEAGEDYPQWRAVQVMRADAKRESATEGMASNG